MDPHPSALARSREDPAAFGAFYRAHAERLVVFLTRRTLDAEVAFDLAAETFAKAYGGRRRFRGTTEAEAAAWLYTIARHELASFFRRGRIERRAVERLGLRVPELGDHDLERLEELAGVEGLRALVGAELARLSADQRDALQLRVVDELGYDEVARRLAVSEPTARARVSRGLRALADALPQDATLERGA